MDIYRHTPYSVIVNDTTSVPISAETNIMRSATTTGEFEALGEYSLGHESDCWQNSQQHCSNTNSSATALTHAA